MTWFKKGTYEEQRPYRRWLGGPATGGVGVPPPLIGCCCWSQMALCSSWTRHWLSGADLTVCSVLGEPCFPFPFCSFSVLPVNKSHALLRMQLKLLRFIKKLHLKKRLQHCPRVEKDTEKYLLASIRLSRFTFLGLDSKSSGFGCARGKSTDWSEAEWTSITA